MIKFQSKHYFFYTFILRSEFAWQLLLRNAANLYQRIRNCMPVRKLLVLLLLVLGSCKQTFVNPHVQIDTRFCEIEVELYPGQAPASVAAFLAYVDSGLYKNASFYRVLNDENQPSNAFKSKLVQGGIWQSNYQKSIKLPGIAHESTNQTHILHKNGTISLARQAPGTASTEFFICLGNQPGFDYGGKNNPDGQGYAAFGKVVKGMDVVQKIYNAPENDQSFDPPVDIYRVIRL